MEKLQIQGVSEMSSEEMKLIDGGVMIGLVICLFALGMAVGIGIGNRVQRRWFDFIILSLRMLNPPTKH